MNPDERKQELAKLIAHHQKRYHEDDAPEISDEAYDSLVAEYQALTGVDEGVTTDVANAVGGAPSEAFAKVTHAVRQWSFSNIFSEAELKEWHERVVRGLELDAKHSDVDYVCEHKIDGLKLVVTYEAGEFVRAATRGNGVIGEDVSHTARTINTLPLKLKKPVDLICVGEVWLSGAEFARINTEREREGQSLFANPRNAAAGSLRQLDPEVARRRNLSFFAYDIDRFDARASKLAEPTTQAEELSCLEKLGLPVNEHYQLCHTLAEVTAYYERWVAEHDALPYGVDGVVIKVNRRDWQRSLGYTAKSPRYGVAYKFPATQATTVVEDIVLQVGRTGVVTPVAHLRPVFIDGSTVSRATLHNEDHINRLDVRIGDTVVLQKAGDVIPEVVSVIKELRPKRTKSYRFPEFVEGCGGDGRIERIPGVAAYRCVARDSDFLRRQRLYYFVSKTAFNIDGVGPKILDALIDAELVNAPSDLFSLTKDDFLLLPGFKERAADNAVSAIAQARTVPLERLLVALSIENVGEETARLIASHLGTVENIRSASVADIEAIHGIGLTVAESVISWFENPAHAEELDRLLEHIEVEAPEATRSEKLAGQTVVFTGTLPTLSRDEAERLARQHGATATSSVSAKTDFVVAGEHAGTKQTKAEALGVPVLTEAEFLARIS